jgi:hypothetical protein
LRVNLLSVSALENDEYFTLFKRGHVFIYREGVDPVEPQLIGDRVDWLYMLRGQPSGYDSASNEEQEAPETSVTKIAKIAINQDLIQKTINSKKIAGKICRFFDNFLGKNREKIAC